MRDKITEKKIGMPMQQLLHVGNVLLCALVLLFLSACGNGELPNEDSSEEVYVEDDNRKLSDAPLMTREYVIDHGYLTEDELYGVDFEAMVTCYGLYEGLEEEFEQNQDVWDMRKLFLLIREEFLLPGYGFFDYTWLVTDTAQEEKFTEKDIDQITVIGFEDHGGTYNRYMVFDLVENKVYIGENYDLLHKIGAEPTNEIPLTDDQTEEIKNIIRSSAVHEWDKLYEGTSEGTTGSFSWSLYYALEDGRIYSHSGNGVLGRNTPDSYRALEDGFEAFWILSGY